MTPQKFSNYQKECYNPGSPNLQAQALPFQAFPKRSDLNSILEEEVSCVKTPESSKINLRPKRKRKTDVVDKPSVSKKPKMEAQMLVLQEQLSVFSEQHFVCAAR